MRERLITIYNKGEAKTCDAFTVDGAYRKVSMHLLIQISDNEAKIRYTEKKS